VFQARHEDSKSQMFTKKLSANICDQNPRPSA